MSQSPSAFDRSHRLSIGVLLVVMLTGAAQAVIAQSPVVFEPQRVRVSERSNLSHRVDGRYEGLTSRQTTGYFTRIGGNSDGYVGRFFEFEQVRRDANQVARSVRESSDLTLSIDERTLFGAVDGNGLGRFPSLQGIPGLPAYALARGSSWQTEAFYVARPRTGEPEIRLPVIVEYRYTGHDTFNGVPVHRIEAGFATRYPLPERDDEGPVVDYSGPIESVAGSHRLTILLPLDGHSTLFIRDELQEQYRYKNGSVVAVQGHTLLFVQSLGTDAVQRTADRISDRIATTTVDDVTVDRTPTGVRVTIDALRFLPDQAILLPQERGRIDEIALALADLDGVRYLIVGHTADIGLPESQLALSIDRARVIASELGRRGIHPDRIDIEGRGGTDPVAANDTEEGRARNRRVEIFILEE